LNGYCNLGKCYHYGLGTEMNTKEAVVWYKKALNSGIDTSTELNEILS
jgi:TPR repeat protein